MAHSIRRIDIDRERSERLLTRGEFLRTYNEGLPAGFPLVSVPLLNTFSTLYPSLFDKDGAWSLDRHRKKVMDWLPMHVRASKED